jgi:hypothetical protein
MSIPRRVQGRKRVASDLEQTFSDDDVLPEEDLLWKFDTEEDFLAILQPELVIDSKCHVSSQAELSSRTHQVTTANGKNVRLRVGEQMTATKWSLLDITLQNIGFLPGPGGRGFLLRGFRLSLSDRTVLFKLISFQYSSRFILLESAAQNPSFTASSWKAYMSSYLSARQGQSLNAEDCKPLKTYRFGRNRYSLSTSEYVSHYFHDSLKLYGLVATPSRNTGGLAVFGYPGPDLIDIARNSVLCKLPMESQKHFCEKQLLDDSKHPSIEDFMFIGTVANHIVENALDILNTSKRRKKEMGCSSSVSNTSKSFTQERLLLQELDRKQTVEASVQFASPQIESANTECLVSGMQIVSTGEPQMTPCKKSFQGLSVEDLDHMFVNKHFKAALCMGRVSYPWIALLNLACHVLSPSSVSKDVWLQFYFFIVPCIPLWLLGRYAEDSMNATKLAGQILLSLVSVGVLVLVGYFHICQEQGKILTIFTPAQMYTRLCFQALQWLYISYMGIDPCFRVPSLVLVLLGWVSLPRGLFAFDLSEFWFALVSIMILTDVVGCFLRQRKRSIFFKAYSLLPVMVPTSTVKQKKVGERLRTFLILLYAASTLYHLSFQSISMYSKTGDFLLVLSNLVVPLLPLCCVGIVAWKFNIDNTEPVRLLLQHTMILPQAAYFFYAYFLLPYSATSASVSISQVWRLAMERWCVSLYLRLDRANAIYRAGVITFFVCVIFATPPDSFVEYSKASTSMIFFSAFVFGEMMGEFLEHYFCTSDEVDMPRKSVQ